MPASKSNMGEQGHARNQAPHQLNCEPYIPPSHTVSSGLFTIHKRREHPGPRPTTWSAPTYPQMMACHTMMLLSSGSPLTPAGGSFFNFLKSRNKRRRAAVDMATCTSKQPGGREGGWQPKLPMKSRTVWQRPA